MTATYPIMLPNVQISSRSSCLVADTLDSVAVPMFVINMQKNKA